MGTQSYCSVCDSPGACEHTDAHRYLDEIVYERIDGGAHPGWKVPESERARWEASDAVQAHFRRQDGGPPRAEAKDLQKLVVELEGWIDIAGPLEANIRAAYEKDPLKVSRLSDSAIDGARRGSLTNPGGWLWTQIAKLGAGAEW